MPKNRKRKTKRNPSRPKARGAAPSPRPKSRKTAVGLVVLGALAAAVVAIYLAFGTGGSATSAADAALLDAAPDGHVRGPDNANVTLVEYGDFECPTCADFHYIVGDLLRRMPDELELEFHHFPLPVGPNSVTAALAAEAAAEQGRYWEMHDALFETQRQWSGREDVVELFTSMAGQLGLDTGRFVQDLQSAEIRNRVVTSRQRGAELGITGTPAFFINGQRLNMLPQNADQFEAILRTTIIK